MPRFFLHIKDGSDLIRDEEGIDVPSAAHARDAALLSARELWAGAIRAGRDVRCRRFPDCRSGRKSTDVCAFYRGSTPGACVLRTAQMSSENAAAAVQHAFGMRTEAAFPEDQVLWLTLAQGWFELANNTERREASQKRREQPLKEG